MTTKVKIINESDPNSYDNHIILVVGADGTKNIVGPGKFVETHVWQGTQIVVTEVDVKGERRGNPDSGYGALPPEKCEGCEEANRLFENDPVEGRYGCTKHGHINR